MTVLFLAIVTSIFAFGYCGNYTVTEEIWLDIEIADYEGPGEEYRGRIVVGVFGDTCPMTALNFQEIAKGFRRGNEFLSYKNTRIHRIIPDFVVQGGDNTHGDGSGGKSIYGDKFIDENYKLSHRATGIVSMANHGKDTNGSQFFILLNKARWLDKRHVVFGKVVKGMEVLRAIAGVDVDQNNAVPRTTIRIIDSGVMSIPQKYELSEEQIDSEDDVA